MDQAIIGLTTKFNGYGMALFVLVTTLIAGFLAAIIGLEREMKGQAAGLRTHVLLAEGSSLMMTLSIFACNWAIAGYTGTDPTDITMWKNYDSTRIAAGVVSGIGFLCAGTIIKNGVSVRGLTTAATLWLCGGIGLACGAGFILEAIVTTFIALFFLLGLIWVEKAMDKKSPQVHMIVAASVPVLKEIHEVADHNRLIIKNIISETIKDENGKDFVDITVFFAFKSDLASISDFCENFAGNTAVYHIKGGKFDKRS
jgi:putative Mg2+ transporter-C (MgtC) family protein